MKRDCDRRWEIDALRDGRLGERDARAFERHARTCDVCAEAIAGDARLRRLGAEMRSPEASELDLRRLRARVLHDVAHRRRGLGHAPAVAAACALAALMALLLSRRSPPPHVITAPLAATSVSSPPRTPTPAPPSVVYASTVQGDDGSRWSRTRDGSVEHLRLEEGTLRVNVRHQRDGERFLVDLPDGELEVRGTTFVVAASESATARVSVEEGVVVLRIRGLPAALVLKAGEAWTASERETRAAHGPPAAPHVAVASAPSARVSAPPPAPAADDGPAEYGAAVALWQHGRYAEAATALQAFVVAHPSSPELEDASFLEAASLSRAGRADAAALVAEDHLARFPASFHRRDASILVARAARDRGDCPHARAVLAPWSGSDDEVRRTLGECAGVASPGP
jgi:TolA-binding protein